MNINSFKRGYLKVPKGKLQQVKQEIMTVLEIYSKSAWFSKIDGRTTLKQIEKEAVEKIFEKHGITDIWGEY
jgi:hypothetical protein